MQIVGQLFTVLCLVVLVALIVREYSNQQGWRGRQLARFISQFPYLLARWRRLRPCRRIKVVVPCIEGPYYQQKSCTRRQLAGWCAAVGALMILSGVAMLLQLEWMFAGLITTLAGVIGFVLGFALYFHWSNQDPPRRVLQMPKK